MPEWPVKVTQGHQHWRHSTENIRLLLTVCKNQVLHCFRHTTICLAYVTTANDLNKQWTTASTQTVLNNSKKSTIHLVAKVSDVAEMVVDDSTRHCVLFPVVVRHKSFHNASLWLVRFRDSSVSSGRRGRLRFGRERQGRLTTKVRPLPGWLVSGNRCRRWLFG